MFTKYKKMTTHEFAYPNIVKMNGTSRRRPM